MPKKTYRTYFLKGLDIHTYDAKGYPVEVVFRSGIQVDSTAKFTTRDENVQKALEASARFGKDFYIEKVEEDAPVVAEEVKPVEETKPVAVVTKPEFGDVVKDTRRFHNLVEMKNAMAEVGISVTPEMNYLAAKSAASKAGYDFQIQK